MTEQQYSTPTTEEHLTFHAINQLLDGKNVLIASLYRKKANFVLSECWEYLEDIGLHEDFVYNRTTRRVYSKENKQIGISARTFQDSDKGLSFNRMVYDELEEVGSEQLTRMLITLRSKPKLSPFLTSPEMKQATRKSFWLEDTEEIRTQLAVLIERRGIEYVQKMVDKQCKKGTYD